MGRDEGRTAPIHLALIPRSDHRDDFVRIAEFVRAEDPAVRPVILKDRRNRVRWKPRATGIGRKEDNDDRIVQEFIYTGPWPTSYRVVTLFGTSLVAYRVDADRDRPGLPSRYGFGDVGRAQPTIVSNSRGCRIHTAGSRRTRAASRSPAAPASYSTG